MINYSVNRNDLIVNNKTVTFKYPVYKAEAHNNLVIVLLEFKNNNNPLDFINELYAVSDSGQIVWKMEDVRRILGKYEPAPLVDLSIIDNKLIAFDFYARKYTINQIDGKIIDLQMGRW